MIIKRSGFILVMALFIISLGSILVTGLLQRAISFDRLHRVRTKQQQARLLALNGIEIARAQLSNPFEIDKKAVDQNLVPFLYVDQVQLFGLDAQKDGLEGTIKLYISAEEGKINLNKLYDFKEKKYIVSATLEGQQIAQECAPLMQKNFMCENFPQTLEQYFNKRGTPLEDLTELVTQKIIGPLFCDADAKPDDQTALTDLFTLSTPACSLQPLYFSRSMAQLLHLEKQDLDRAQRQEIIKKIASFKGQIAWASSWKELLADLYKKDYTVLPDVMKKSLASKIEVTAFNVISYGTVDNGDGMPVTQKVCAYLEKSSPPEKKSPDAASSAAPAGGFSYTVKRLYWL